MVRKLVSLGKVRQSTVLTGCSKYSALCKMQATLCKSLRWPRLTWTIRIVNRYYGPVPHVGYSYKIAIIALWHMKATLSQSPLWPCATCKVRFVNRDKKISFILDDLVSQTKSGVNKNVDKTFWWNSLRLNGKPVKIAKIILQDLYMLNRLNEIYR